MTELRESEQELVDRLSSTFDELSPKLKRVARFILDKRNEVGVSTIRQIAAQSGVSSNAVMRLAKHLGYESYDEFRNPFRETVRRGGNGSFPEQARWLQQISRSSREGRLLAQLAEADIENIEQVFRVNDTGTFVAAAKRIIKADRCFILGMRSSHSIAYNFYYVVQMLLKDVQLIPGQASSPIDALVKSDKEDVLLAVAFHPYARETIEAWNFVRGRGAGLIAVTDSRTSPLTRGADYVFLTPTKSPQFFTSIVAATALLEALTAFIVGQSDNEAVTAIDELDSLRHRMGVYWEEPIRSRR